MVSRAILRVSLALAAFLSGANPSFADWKEPAQIFDTQPRSQRSIVLKNNSWAKDSIDSDEPWLDIDLMMEVGDVQSYFEGVEVQYEMRKVLLIAPCTDILVDSAKALPDTPQREQIIRARKACWQGAYEAALKTAKNKIENKRNASHWRPVTFESPGDFVAVFDADETLLTQWFNPLKEFPNFRLSWFTDGLLGVPSDSVGEKKSGNLVRFAPGAEEAIIRVRYDAHCKAVALFSAKDDTAMQFIYDHWKSRREDALVSATRADGRPLIDAVFSRSHLTMSGDSVGGVARIPSKNLRIFDPKLEHVVIVDDNPARIIPEQQYMLRAQPKFDSRRFGESEDEKQGGNRRFWKYYSVILAQTTDEIIESSLRAEGEKASKVPVWREDLQKLTFFQAFRPYSYAGRRVFEALKLSIPTEEDEVGVKPTPAAELKIKLLADKFEREALEAARTHPELYGAAFDSK